MDENLDIGRSHLFQVWLGLGLDIDYECETKGRK